VFAAARSWGFGFVPISRGHAIAHLHCPSARKDRTGGTYSCVLPSPVVDVEWRTLALLFDGVGRRSALHVSDNSI